VSAFTTVYKTLRAVRIVRAARHTQAEAISATQCGRKRQMMDHLGVEYIVILTDPELRRGVTRETHPARRSARATGAGLMLRRWLADTLRVLATRIEPAPIISDLTPTPAVR
jgi:hypothetical protein